MPTCREPATACVVGCTRGRRQRSAPQAKACSRGWVAVAMASPVAVLCRVMVTACAVSLTGKTCCSCFDHGTTSVFGGVFRVHLLPIGRGQRSAGAPPLRALERNLCVDTVIG